MVLKNNIIVITGATASGKSDIAIELSNHLPIEIISADSRQIYKYLNIGTAKPTKDELEKVKHHLIDFLEPNEYFSAGKFAETATNLISEIQSRDKIPVIVGGTGFYIKSLFEGLYEYEIDEKVLEIRENLNKELEINGIENLYKKLEVIDPQVAEFYTDKNPRRIIKALEHYYSKGQKISESWKNNIESNLNPIYFVPRLNREQLYERINQRVLKMIDFGLIQEVKNILVMGFDKSLNSFNTVGYKEIISYLDGEIELDFAISEIQKNTRRYAKRQTTWINNQISQINYINNASDIVEVMVNPSY